MGCVTTHDTKRSAGVRARLAVLTQVADDWTRKVECWHRLNRTHRTRVRGRLRPERHVEYQCYQTLVGIWPVGGIPSAEAVQHTGDRLAAYMEKAIREAKQRTSWVAPHPAYEDAVRAFARGILADPRGAFAREIHDLATRVARVARLETLARTLIHLTAAGVPDIYQGDELDRLLLVDPDNRRPVAFDEREERLREIAASSTWEEHERSRWIQRSLAEPRVDRLKLWITYHALALRRREPDLFQRASYVPLATDPGADVVAFARRRAGRSVIAVAGRHLARCVRGERVSEGVGARGRYDPTTWENATISLPPEYPGRWRCVLGGHEVATGSDGLEMSQVLSRLPAALLVPA